MEDLSSISQAIQDIFKSPNANDDAFTGLVQSYLQSPNSSVRHVALEVLNEVISDGSVSELKVRRRLIFEETVLTYLPLLLPLRSDSPETVESLIEACLDVCSPREAILALNEGCQLLEELAERYDVSDDDEEMDDLPDDYLPKGDRGVDLEELLNDYILVIDSYAQVFARMPRIKSSSTLFTVSDAVSSSLQRLLPGLSPFQAKALASSFAQMIQAAYIWVGRSADAGGEQRAILTSLLHMSITLLVPRTHSTMTTLWFLAHYPQYDLSRSTSPVQSTTASSSQPTPLDALATTATSLDISTSDLLSLISRNSSLSRASPFAPFSAMTLLAHQLSQPLYAQELEALDLPGVDDLLVLLSSGLGGSATDAAGTLAWEAIHRARVIDFDFASPLIEVLMPLATSDPDDMKRLAWYKLIQAIIEKSPAGQDQIMLLGQLLEPANPYDTLRPQALSILRALLSAAAATSSATSSSSFRTGSIFQPGLIDYLPLLPSVEHLSLSTMEFTNGPNGTFVTEQLNTLWLLCELDRENESGVRGQGYLEKIWASLGEVRRKIQEVRNDLLKDGGEMGLEEFMVLRLETAVERLEVTISL